MASRSRPACLDIEGEVLRLDSGARAELVRIAPGEEPADGPIAGHAGVLVADGSGGEFQERRSA